MKRTLTIALLTGVALIGQAAPALATDLGDYLERAAASEYSGEVFVVCDTPDGTVAQFVEVTRSAGELWVRTSSAEAISTSGEL